MNSNFFGSRFWSFECTHVHDTCLKIRDSSFLIGVMWQLLASKISKNGPSGNRTRVLGFEAQEDVLYPMDPAIIRMRTVGGTAF